MSEAVIGLIGVLLGGLISGVTTHLAETARWRRDQLLELHAELATLHAAKWPGGDWHEVLELLARIRVRMLLLGFEASLLAKTPEKLLEARRSAEKVPGHELDEDEEFVWIMRSAPGEAVDDHLDQLTRAATPRKGWVRRWGAV